MISTEQARTLAEASHASYGDALIPTGYELVQPRTPLNDPDTGFNAKIYRKIGTNDCIVAFTGLLAVSRG